MGRRIKRSALVRAIVWGVLTVSVCTGHAQQTTMAGSDRALEAAEALMGRALFLRGFYVANDLGYDATGHLTGTSKPSDWTLAGMDVKKVERRGPKQIYLEGLRVAIRYNPDNHQFERHPQNGETIKMTIADGGDSKVFEAALDTIFAQGIDPELQRSMPPFWLHYFNPSLAFPQDALTGQTVYAMNGLPNQATDVTPPSAIHKPDAKMTSYAERDKVHGSLQLRMVVDAEGTPQRIVVARPLGYGLEERAVEAVSKWRFTPAMRQGKPVATALLLNYDFEFLPVRP